MVSEEVLESDTYSYSRQMQYPVDLYILYVKHTNFSMAIRQQRQQQRHQPQRHQKRQSISRGCDGCVERRKLNTILFGQCAGATAPAVLKYISCMRMPGIGVLVCDHLLYSSMSPPTTQYADSAKYVHNVLSKSNKKSRQAQKQAHENCWAHEFRSGTKHTPEILCFSFSKRKKYIFIILLWRRSLRKHPQRQTKWRNGRIHRNNNNNNSTSTRT